MKMIINIAAILSIAFAAELEIGSTMPKMEQKLQDISGRTMTLADAKGDQGTLVVFSCNTCPWVINWEDRYLTLADTYISKGIGMIAVNSNSSRFNGSESLDEMVSHADKIGYQFPYAQDPGSELAYAFGATKTPHIYLFDKEDKLVYRGAIDDNGRDASKVDEPFLANAIDELLSGDSISKTTSKAMGCSIKFP
jgi:thioredoxin-related protein|tara:strand:+ start:4420 stop:5004 length:585 start_codon:yes stop_codon:yes gene_type:complete